MAEIRGTGFDDTLGGTQVTDAIDAGLGNDIVIGLTGDDTLSGGSGDDLLFGGTGEDILFGTVEILFGDDPVIGPSDDDVLVGGNGADFFVFDLRRPFASNAGDDVIQDFERGDTIILAGLAENLDTNGNRRLDPGDARVDEVSPQPSPGVSDVGVPDVEPPPDVVEVVAGRGTLGTLRIDLTDAMTVAGTTAQGSITLPGIIIGGIASGLAINQDLFLA